MSERLPEHDHELLADDVLEHGVGRLVQSIQDREEDFSRREERIEELERLLDVQRQRAERLEGQLKEAEQRSIARERELDERERTLDVREVKLEAEEELRLAKLERSERFVAELKQQVEARETRVSAQVTQMQAGLRHVNVASLTRVVNNAGI
jgi:DNA repair exonuclease SbcCD ATPase subunit